MRLHIATLMVAAGLYGFALTSPAAAQVQSDATSGGDIGDNPAGHGSVSIAYLGSYQKDLVISGDIKSPIGGVHSRGLGLGVSYNVTNDWSVFGGIRYFDNRYAGNAPNCPTITASPACAAGAGGPPLNPQHPETPFIDDGKYHGAWQDFTLGAAYHANIGGYFITPSVTATIPSHDYVFYGTSYFGQRLRQLLFAATLAHQFDFTNIYYKLGYGYGFSEHVLGVNTGYQRADAELGWFVNEKFSVNAFLTGRQGNGLSAPELGARSNGKTNDYWYRRSQLAEHSYRAYGFGFDYDFGNRYVASFNVQHEYWGETVFDFKYVLEARLTRNF